MAVRGRWFLFGGLAVGVLAADQLAKAWVDSSFELASIHRVSGTPGGPTPLLGEVVRIAKTYNSGGLFGLFGSTAPLLALASLAVIGLIVVYHARSVGRGPLLLSAILGLLLGGALGNLVDRVRFGYVIDFADMGVGGLRWYTFNVADAAISCAIVGLLALSVLGERLERASPVLPEDADRGEAVDPASGSAKA